MHEGYQDTFEKINKLEKFISFLYNRYYVELIWPFEPFHL